MYESIDGVRVELRAFMPTEDVLKYLRLIGRRHANRAKQARKAKERAYHQGRADAYETTIFYLEHTYQKSFPKVNLRHINKRYKSITRF